MPLREGIRQRLAMVKCRWESGWQIKNPHLAARVKSNSGDELEGGVRKIYPHLSLTYRYYKLLRLLTSLDERLAETARSLPARPDDGLASGHGIVIIRQAPAAMISA